MYWEAVYVGRENIGLGVGSLSLNPRSVISLGRLLNLTEPKSLIQKMRLIICTLHTSNNDFCKSTLQTLPHYSRDTLKIIL